MSHLNRSKPCTKVHIGHASSGSKPFVDQVLISNYYNGTWTVLLRPRTRAIAEKSAAICEACCTNKHIGYSQSSRNTLKQSALRAAGLTASDENLAKITVEHIANITNTCYADCSSFMNFCATVAGAKVAYGSSAAVTHTMEQRFTKYNDYTVIRTKNHLNSANYLQRGDILVRAGVAGMGGHTVMVLDDGADVPLGGIGYEDSYFDVISTKVTARITSVSATKIAANLKITEIKSNKEQKLEDESILKLYTWSYKVESLENNKASSFTANLKLDSTSTDFSVTNLIPDHSYTLAVSAYDEKGNIRFGSSTIIFRTPQAYPKSVTNLLVRFNDNKLTAKSFSLSFNPPSIWGNSSLQKCYRLSLLINGVCMTYSDEIIKVDSSVKHGKTIALHKLIPDTSIFRCNDIVQIGIQPGLKDKEGNFIFDSDALCCSKPLQIEGYLTVIDKIYIKIKNTFKRVVLYKNKI